MGETMVGGRPACAPVVATKKFLAFIRKLKKASELSPVIINKVDFTFSLPGLRGLL